MPYLDGVGRTPKVKILGKTRVVPGGESMRLLIKEVSWGHPMEAREPLTDPCFVDERRVYKRLTTNGQRYTLEGAPDMEGVPVIESESAFWEEEKQRKREAEDKSWFERYRRE